MADDDDGPPPDEEHPEDEEEEVIEMADSERASRLLQDDDEDEGEDEGEGDDEDDDQESVQRLCRMMSNTLFLGFESHVKALEQARERRREALAFKSAVEEGGGAADEGAAKQTQDELDGMGIWMPGDNYQGDVNMRTLQKLLARVDARGFERSAQQLEFHQAFMKAAARVLYKGDWETDRPIIMEKYGWTRCNSEVLISTPRRFGKTYSIAIFCACLAMTFGLEIVVFSPARRASRKLLERIVEFIRLAGGDAAICEYNQARSRLERESISERALILLFAVRRRRVDSTPSTAGKVWCAVFRPRLGYALRDSNTE